MYKKFALLIKKNVLPITLVSVFISALVWILITPETALGSTKKKTSATGKKVPPNILFIMSDDHTYQAIGVYHSRLAGLNPTPVLDKLAKEGMVFDKAFCSNSICTPSRACIMTGQYSQTNRVLDLYSSLPVEKQYLAIEMKKAGYTTAVIGKWHLKNPPDSFDYYNVFPGQGKYINPVLYTKEGKEKKKIRFDSRLSREVYANEYKGHSSDVVTDITIDWLENKRDKSKPFFLMCQFKAPHDMFINAPRYNNYLKNVEIPEPVNMYNQPAPGFGSVATRGMHDSLIHVIGSSVSKRMRIRNMGKSMNIDPGLSDHEYTHQAYQKYLKRYLRCVKGVDDNLARMFSYLKENGLMKNTVIIYTSDQGLMLGAHDFIDKRWMYEESMRIPLIVYYPKMVKPGSRNNWLINNTDFAPTILELAGANVPCYMQGKSFIKALQGEKKPDDWRKATYYRYWMHMAHNHNNPACFGIRTNRYKLIFYYGTDFTSVHKAFNLTKRDGNRYWADTPVAWEFYDLEKDPHEMYNLYGDPAYFTIISQLKKQLAEKRKKLNERDELFPRIQEIINKHWND